jgi:hypothetical protein
MTTNDDDRRRDEWDVITGTLNGGVIWRRYSDGRIVVTYGDENPQDVVSVRQYLREAKRMDPQNLEPERSIYDDH